MKCPKCGQENPREMTGMEIRGVYDGVLFWVCNTCNHAFPRDWGDNKIRQALSQDYADNYNRNNPTKKESNE